MKVLAWDESSPPRPTFVNLQAGNISGVATSSQGSKADSALQSVPDATTSVKGLALKSAALTNAAPGAMTINVGGSISLTLAAITGAVYATDSTSIKNVISSIADTLNKTNLRLEELISKQQSAGQQT